MPESGQKPHGQQISEGQKGAPPVASQWNVHIFPEPTAQGHMPSSPKFRHRQGHVWMMKVIRKLKPHHGAQSFCHKGIPAEVKINLKAEGSQAKPGQGRGYTVIADCPDIAP